MALGSGVGELGKGTGGTEAGLATGDKAERGRTGKSTEELAVQYPH